MTPDQAARFAKDWAEAFNSRDLDAVLDHFHDQVVFSSPKALETVGIPTVRGKAALRAYWEKALARIQTLHFQVDHVFWHPENRTLGILYDREVNGSRDRAMELLQFDGAGRVIHGEVLYGVHPGA